MEHKLQTAELNKKKMAAARQFNKAAIHVKEIKVLKEELEMSKERMEHQEQALSQKRKVVDELSMKLPTMK